MEKHTIRLQLAQESLQELFEILDRFGVSQYQKMAEPTMPEYQGQDWRQVTVNGVQGYFHASGEPLGGLMAGHLSTRIWAAATTPVVRELGPLLNNLFKTFAQFIAFTIIGGVVLLTVYFASGEIPDQALRAAVMAISLVPLLFGFIVVGDMVRITYRKPQEVVYPTVEAFPDREPM